MERGVVCREGSAGVSRLKVVWRLQKFDKAWGWNFRKEGEGKTGR